MSRKKKITLIISVSLVLIIVLGGGLSAIFSYVYHYKGTSKNNPWYSTDTFNIANIPTIEKDPNEDFVILNLADIQMCDLENTFNRKTIHKEITYLVNEINPDLITLTGDQVWSNENLMCLKHLIKWMESYKIPWAPIFGNHDYGNDYDSAVASLNYSCDLYEKAKYCLFDRGPSNLGTLGNYVINITENGKLFKTIYMLDSGYLDEITDEQIEWFKWNTEGVKNVNNGNYSSSLVFLHKPLPEFADAYYSYVTDNTLAVGDVYRYCSLYGSNQNGFFEIAKNSGVQDIICGHQHTNNFTIKYEDVRLTFALKTGELGFYYDDGNINLNGATYLTLSNDSTKISNIFVDSNQFHIKGTENIYLD